MCKVSEFVFHTIRNIKNNKNVSFNTTQYFKHVTFGLFTYSAFSYPFYGLKLFR